MKQQSYLSFWEYDTWFKHVDFTIIGSGIVGLTTAIFLTDKFPKAKVIVVESGVLPHGATTRNAGFACFGSPSEIIADIELHGKEKAYQLVQKRYDGLQKLLSLHGEQTIDYKPVGGIEVFRTKENYDTYANEISTLNQDLKTVLSTNKDVYKTLNPSQMETFGFSNTIHGILNSFEGHIHSGLLMKSLLEKVQSKSTISLLNGLEISEIVDTGSKLELMTNKGFQFTSSQVLVCTNGFTKKLLPHLDVEPARGQVLVTSPIPNLKLKGTFHHNEGYDYFRDVDSNRVLIGGGRNLDFKTENSSDLEMNEMIKTYLISLLNELVIPDQDFTIDFQWTGLMGIGKEKSPIIESISDRLHVAVRMGGMGVAIGTQVASDLVEKVL